MKSGLPVYHRISSSEMQAMLKRNGFQTKVIPLNPEIYAVKAIPE